MVRGRGYVGALVAVVLLSLGLSACTPPAPTPTPTPTGFADEEQAFAAAEATYRAYVDASNEIDLSEPETFEGMFQWTTGELKASDRRALSEYHAEGLTVSGETTTESFTPANYDPDGIPIVRGTACSNVSSVNLVDASGVSQVGADRPDIYQLELEFVYSASAAYGLLISASTAVEPVQCTE